nr:hypothetical protein [uncultured Altererythrobacter sp.]
MKFTTLEACGTFLFGAALLACIDSQAGCGPAIRVLGGAQGR